MERIQPCLWFDQQAEEAAGFYASLFENSKIGAIVRYTKAAADASGRPEGSVMTVELELAGLKLLALNGGPVFQFNQSISLFVECESEAEIDALWKSLAKETHIPLAEYPYAKKYGWCEDRYGVSWQLMFGSHTGKLREQKVAPALLFVKDHFGKAEEAIRFYVAHFPQAKVETIAHDEKTQAVLFSRFAIAGQDFVAMESPLEHDFDFTPAISLVIPCDSQKEIDSIWSALSTVPEAEQCGWLQDRFGISWQVVHKHWGKWVAEADPERRERLMGAILQMKKPDVRKLEQL